MALSQYKQQLALSQYKQQMALSQNKQQMALNQYKQQSNMFIVKHDLLRIFFKLESKHFFF